MKEYACQRAIGRRIKAAADRARTRKKKVSAAELVFRYKTQHLKQKP